MTQCDELVGARLRWLRLRRGLVAADLACRVGKAEEDIHAYEAGISRIAPQELFSLADALGVEISDFFIEGANEMLADPSPDAVRLLLSSADEHLRIALALVTGARVATAAELVGLSLQAVRNAAPATPTPGL